MTKDTGSTKAKQAVPFGSNEVRLSPREWLIAGTILAVLLYLAPVLWRRVEPFDPEPDYRIPYSLGSDYWMVDRYCRRVASEDKTLLIGDSVVWGHYVPDGETLSHYLNRWTGEDRFANLGVDGIHPAALAGLIECYGRGVSDKNVILHCNFLWMSSPRHDLTSDEEFSMNHSELIPQFVPRIPCYRESLSTRLGVIARRNIAPLSWTTHLRTAYFGGKTLPRWAIEHPRANPIDAITLELPSPNEPPRPEPVARPWTEKRMTQYNPPWVELRDSFQWRCFRGALKTLRRRGNRVFVVIGPFNEHILTDESLRTYKAMRDDAVAWLGDRGIPYYAPSPLPSEQYADASHPLAAGYARLAKKLLENESFRRFDSASK